MSAIAIIPARGGSRRIPGKNKKPFHGRPIIEYAIQAAKDSSLFRLICVTTDDTEIAEIALKNGCMAIHRGREWAQDHVGTQEVMAETVKWFQDDYACCIYPTVPLLSSDDLLGALIDLKSNQAMAYCMAVCSEPHLHDAGQFYWGNRKAFQQRTPLIHNHTIMYSIHPERDCDINTMEDWTMAEKMYEKLQYE